MALEGFESRILQALHSRLSEEIATHSQAIASGNAESFEAYKHRAGQIAGMNIALRIARDIEDDARGVQKGDRT